MTKRAEGDSFFYKKQYPPNPSFVLDRPLPSFLCDANAINHQISLWITEEEANARTRDPTAEIVIDTQTTVILMIDNNTYQLEGGEADV